VNLRTLAIFSTLAALSGAPAFSQHVAEVSVGDGNTAQISDGKSPSVRVIDAEGKDTAQVPIAENPAVRYDSDKSSPSKSSYIATAAYSKSNNTLYVLHDEKKGEHFISAVNLDANRVDKQIPVGAGQETSLRLSGDASRLYAYSACRPGFSCFGEEKYGSPFDPSITVIDTAANRAIATYRLSDGYPRKELKERNAYYVNKFLAASEKGVIIQSEVRRLWNGKDEPLSDLVMGYSGDSSRPVFAINASGPLIATMFSKDQTLLFGIVEGNKKTPASLAVFDLGKGTSSLHALTGHPTMLLRLGANRDSWVLGDEEMRAFSESGELMEKRIALTKARKTEEGGEDGSSVFQDGFPTETISIGDEYAAVLIGRTHARSQHTVALLNLKDLQFVAIISTLSATEKAGIVTKTFLRSGLIGLTGIGEFTIVAPDRPLRNEALAARPDGRFFYTLDLEGHVVTAIDVRSATVVRRIPVNASIARLLVSEDGKHLVCEGKRRQQIDMDSNSLEN